LYYTLFRLIPVNIMVFGIARAAALLALLCPLATPLGIPSSDMLRPRVPWKDTGLTNHQRRQDGYSTGGGCTHGPTSRGCWNGDFNIDTDMDEHWPDTGKVVKVRLLNKYSTSQQLTIIVPS
jgi:hypothetical protein